MHFMQLDIFFLIVKEADYIFFWSAWIHLQALRTQWRLQCLWSVHPSQRDGDAGTGQRVPSQGESMPGRTSEVSLQPDSHLTCPPLPRGLPVRPGAL